MRYYIGMDIGSTGIKGIVVNEKGNIEQTYNYPLKIDFPNLAMQSSTQMIGGGV